MKKKLLLLLTAALLALGLVACGKASTLEDFYSKPLYTEAMDSQIASYEETYASTYSDIDWSVSDNTLTYSYTYAVQVEDVNALKSNLDANLTNEAVAPSITDLEEETGITGVSIQYIYYNNDGTEIYNKTFSN